MEASILGPAADPWALTRNLVAAMTSPDAEALVQQFIYLRQAGFEHRAGEDGLKGRMRRIVYPAWRSPSGHHQSANYQYIQRRYYKGVESWKADGYEPGFQSPWLPTAAACLAFAEIENWGRP